MTQWTILTCEYPPGCGGVGDYTAQVASALAAVGETVTVICPPRPAHVSSESGPTVVAHAGVEVVVLDDVYGRRGRRAIDERLNQGGPAIPSTILVQYVPTGFGLRGANIPWCRWLLARSRRPGTDVRVMFHEPYYEFTRRLTWRSVLQNALALAERWMAKILLRAASRVYVSTDAWRRYLAPHMPAGRSPELVTLPIPSTIPRCHREPEIAARRAQLLGSSSTRLVGHFGTFGAEVEPMLATALTRLLSDDATISAVCVGSGSDEFVRALADTSPAIRERVHGSGRLSAPEAALYLSACDLLLQPYPDGVTTRRTSVMAGLINARAIVTTTGHLTEPVWAETGAVALAAAHDTEALVAAARGLLTKDDDRAALAAQGEKTYRELFALSHTIRALRGAVEGAAA
jgi:glycosyltransferase involved in cell wall biosynthesis